MKDGMKPDMDPTGRDQLVGLIEATFGPDGKLGVRPEGQIPERTFLEGYLELAKSEGFDPKELYLEALENLGNPPGAPTFEDVAPR